MPGNETLLDAPVTPAPVFAYRALRGVLWGSPETPLLQPTNQKQMRYSHDDKENIPAQVAISTRSVRLSESPTKLTPSHKRKRNSGVDSILSPTKSCLRTPGAPTPRREMLKDVSVTFKDPSLSISPEISMKGAQLQANIKSNDTVHPQSNATQTAINSKPVRNVPILLSSRLVMEDRKVQTQSSQTERVAQASGVDIESYMQTTEKEMKKLIRYSQRMREYARKQDEENTKLKQLVEDLQKENERLKRKMGSAQDVDNRARTVGTGLAPNVDKRIRITSMQREDVISSNGRSTSTSTSTSTSQPATNKADQKNLQPRPQSNAIEIHPSQNSKSNTNPRNHRHETQLQFGLGSGSSSLKVPLRPYSNTTMAVPPPTMDTHENNDNDDDNDNTTQRKKQRTVSSALQPDLAPDRLAAARARIRRRTELRKASSLSDDAALIVSNTTSGAGKGQERVREGSSMLDWAGL